MKLPVLLFLMSLLGGCAALATPTAINWKNCDPIEKLDLPHSSCRPEQHPGSIHYKDEGPKPFSVEAWV